MIVLALLIGFALGAGLTLLAIETGIWLSGRSVPLDDEDEVEA